MHWDSLAAWSGKSGNLNVLATKIAGIYAHATRNNQELVRAKVTKLFQHTPDDKQINFVKEEVFGITEGCLMNYQPGTSSHGGDV